MNDFFKRDLRRGKLIEFYVKRYFDNSNNHSFEDISDKSASIKEDVDLSVTNIENGKKTKIEIKGDTRTDGNKYKIEHKNPTNNFVIEFTSHNKNHEFKYGWLLKTQSDYILYITFDEKEEEELITIKNVYLLDTNKLVKFVFDVCYEVLNRFGITKYNELLSNYTKEDLKSWLEIMSIIKNNVEIRYVLKKEYLINYNEPTLDDTKNGEIKNFLTKKQTLLDNGIMTIFTKNFFKINPKINLTYIKGTDKIIDYA